MRNLLTGILLLLLTILFGTKAKAQRVHVGQQIPDISFSQLVNYEGDSLSLRSLKGRAVMIEIWGTGCTSCVADLAHIDELRKQFGKDLFILLANKVSADSTERFFAGHPFIKRPDVPMLSADSLLAKYFPYITIPVIIMIDKAGMVKAITFGQYATTDKLQSLIAGKPLDLPLKADIDNFDDEQPVLAQANGYFREQMRYSSSFFSEIQGQLSQHVGRLPGSQYPYHIFLNAFSILRLYRFAYEEGSKHQLMAANNLELHLRDTAVYDYVRKDNSRENEEWFNKYDYCYDLWVPPSQAKRVYKIMQRELHNYFGFEAVLKRKTVECLVLKRTTTKDLIKSKGGESRRLLNKKPHKRQLYFRNEPFQDFKYVLRTLLEAQHFKTPFVDDTGYSGNIDIGLPSSLVKGSKFFKGFDMSVLESALEKYGLTLVKEQHVADVLVIRDPSLPK